MISFRIVGLMGLVSAHNQEEWYFDQFLGQQELSPPRRLLEKVEMENLSSPPRRLSIADGDNDNGGVEQPPEAGAENAGIDDDAGIQDNVENGDDVGDGDNVGDVPYPGLHPFLDGAPQYMRPALYFALTVWSPFPVWSPFRSMMRFVIFEKSLPSTDVKAWLRPGIKDMVNKLHDFATEHIAPYPSASVRTFLDSNDKLITEVGMLLLSVITGTSGYIANFAEPLDVKARFFVHMLFDFVLPKVFRDALGWGWYFTVLTFGLTFFPQIPRAVAKWFQKVLFASPLQLFGAPSEGEQFYVPVLNWIRNNIDVYVSLGIVFFSLWGMMLTDSGSKQEIVEDEDAEEHDHS